MALCNDGKCPRTRDGEERHSHDSMKENFRTFYKKQRLHEDWKGLLSLTFLIIGVGFGLLVFLLEGISDMSFSYNCVGRAIYDNATVGEYTDCINKNIDIWFNVFVIHLIATLSLTASAVLALSRK